MISQMSIQVRWIHDGKIGRLSKETVKTDKKKKERQREREIDWWCVVCVISIETNTTTHDICHDKSEDP